MWETCFVAMPGESRVPVKRVKVFSNLFFASSTSIPHMAISHYIRVNLPQVVRDEGAIR